MEKSLQIRNSTVEFLTFVLDGKEDGVQVLYKDDTIWATQKAMAVLFEVDRTVITDRYSMCKNCTYCRRWQDVRHTVLFS